MTPEEAIRIIQEELAEHTPHRDSPFYKASELGIEALRFRQRWEQQEGEADFPLLPGETKED